MGQDESETEATLRSNPSALHLREPQGLVGTLQSQNLVIGVERNCLAPLPEDTRPLQEGDRLLFLTDGLTEAADPLDRQLGEDGVVGIASQTNSCRACTVYAG